MTCVGPRVTSSAPRDDVEARRERSCALTCARADRTARLPPPRTRQLMCGITAVLSRRSPIDPRTRLAGMSSLHHRGPDGRQHWMASDGRVALGHTRLSIIDLATGDQPISNEDRTVHIVVNGEFYDFERIRAELQSRGHRFRTKSDSEIALHLYEDFGPECLHHLRGEYAFIVWDERNHCLIAGRDRFGVKPLFYAEHDDALYLG